jgi:hypothetical protein
MNEAQRIRPSLWYLSIGVALILAGIGLFVYFLFEGIGHITDSLTQVVVPGKAELTLNTPGTYTIFLEEQSVVDGQIYSTTEAVNGLKCTVTSQPGEQEITLTRPSASTTYNVGGRSGRSVLQFHIEESGQYELACDYPSGTEGPKAVLAVGTGVGARIVRTIGLSFAAIFGGIICGGAVVVAVLVMRERAKKKLTGYVSPYHRR